MTSNLGNKEIMAQNIRRYIEKLGMNAKEFALELDFKYTTVLDWLNAKTYPRIDKIEIMANYFKIEKSDLVEQYQSDNSTIQAINDTAVQLHPKRQENVLDYAKDQLNEQKTEENNKNTVTDNVVKLFDYNYYDQPASAGTGQYLNDVRVEKISLPVDVNADFVIPIYGNSMEPEYHSGDYVFVKLSVDLSDGDIGVFEYCGDAYIKQLVIEENGAFLHSLNQNGEYPDIRIDSHSDFRIIGKVVGTYKG